MKPTRLRRESEKAKSNRELRREVVAQVRRRDANRCRGRNAVPDVACWGDLQPHELIRRAQWPGGIFVVDNVILLCEAHHRWTHAEPDAACAAGLLRRSYERGEQ